ncbi:hypothetical protein SSBR45G_00830 [Bradyrhizobium sp. SSBR45G]|uniref:DUF2066 domain-containing protein n=1 Tax=unclassified Bradyrhizobium TaxID=2631580 RepID=UPI002342A4F6|nr:MULTISPECIES: DUF2066 domain-containing protein [unclassified Bradyrhizobium]GLH75175.1 hypothetical protein SSBR45G_00830 [Bradyrhizobium sp. SSBR45G]GLH83038.1 hypothetical protein SSBR45R_04980 [Bradyrhizobium sp. SSBR45R]
MERRRILHCGAWCLGFWLIAGLCTNATAGAGDLYSAQTVVTGQGADNRQAGFAICLEDVLIKVSGAYQLSGDARLAPFKAKASDFVAGFDYHDQMSGKPKHDEQGTRDRPYDLTVSFDHGRIDDLLQKLGVKPWPAPRPSVGVIVAMTSGSRSFLVVSDDRQSDLQRDALRAAAAKRGLDIVLPTTSQATRIDIGRAALPPAALLPGAEMTLLGHLTWDEAKLAWESQWQLDAAGAKRRWRLRGATFDDTFRRGLGDVAQILSGNGAP